MHRSLQAIADTNDGTILRREALDVVDHAALDRALRTGQLLQSCPRTYIDPACVTDRRTMLLAAARYGGPASALSHTSALEVWQLPVPAGQPIHLMTDDHHHLRGAPGIRVHRREGFLRDQTDVVVRDGIRITRLERAIVDSWPLVDRDVQRAPAILATNRRLTTPDRLMDAIGRAPCIGGRSRLIRLVGLLRLGCRSHLELWGYERVFTGAAFTRLRWQEKSTSAAGPSTSTRSTR